MKFRDWKEEGRKLRAYVMAPERRRQEVLLLLVFVILAGLLTWRGTVHGGKYLIADGGTVKGVERTESDSAVTFPVVVTAKKDGKAIRKEVYVTVSGEEKTADSEEEKNEDFSVLLSRALREAEESGDKRVVLPDQLSDGTKVQWKKVRNLRGVQLLFLYPAVVLLFFVSKRAKERAEERERQGNLRKELPAFNDRILMMLGSGLVLSDAFGRAVAAGADRPGAFGQLLAEVREEAGRSRKDLFLVYQRVAVTEENRILARQAGILSEYREKGAMFTEQLARESERLWEGRKRLAEKQGKLAETKLVVPLVILLLALLLVTTAPMFLGT